MLGKIALDGFYILEFRPKQVSSTGCLGSEELAIAYKTAKGSLSVSADASCKKTVNFAPASNR